MTTAVVATYTSRREEIEAHLCAIDLGLEKHQKRQEQDPRNWGYAGDLAEVLRLLGEAARMLGQQA